MSLLSLDGVAAGGGLYVAGCDAAALDAPWQVTPVDTDDGLAFDALLAEISHVFGPCSVEIEGEEEASLFTGELSLACHCGSTEHLTVAVSGEQGGSSTPSCITGCEKPELPQAALSVDWIGFTFKADEVRQDEAGAVARLKLLLGDDWLDKEAGRYGYASGVKCGNVEIWWGGHEKGGHYMGVHAEITGEGCRELEGRFKRDTGKELDWLAWVRERDAEGASWSRLDFAFDDTKGMISLDQVEQAWRSREVVSQFAKMVPHEEVGRDGEVLGRELGFGKRESDVAVKMYDKALQLKAKLSKQQIGELSLEKQRALEEGWTRVELRVKNERADCLVDQLIHRGWPAVAGALRKYLAFKEPGQQQQRRRWNDADWWLSFLGWADTVRLKVDGVVATVQSAIAYIERQAGPSLKMIHQAIPDAATWLQGVLDNAKLGNRHEAKIKAYASEQEQARAERAASRSALASAVSGRVAWPGLSKYPNLGRG